MALSTLGAGDSALAKTQAARPSSSPAQPQQTSASFGDWVVRCQATGQSKICEVAQTLIMAGQQAPIAQIAFGGERAQTMTVLLPTNIAFDKPPQISFEGTDTTAFAFRRCLPAGCFADAKIDAAHLKSIEDATKPGRLSFTDAAEQTLALPISLRGFPQAVDYFNQEPATH
jgi:invasion protein IalB